MMDASSERIVMEALQALERGQPLAEILKRYPQHEEELRPILETAVALSKVRVAHSLAAQAGSRQQMLAQAAALSNGKDQPPALFVWFRRMIIVLSPLLVIFVIFVAGLSFASAEALPGDFLYSTKRGVERLRLSLTSNPVAREALQMSFEEERIQEVERLLASGQQAEVSFNGVIESMNEDTWIVAGLQVFLTSETEVEGQPIAGRYAWVEATTSDGRLIANAIAVEFTPEPSPTPEPTPQEAEIITTEVPPPATPTPTATTTRTPTPTATTTSTEDIDSPSASPVETPTAVSEDDRNENINGDKEDDDDENGNDDDNDDDGNDNDDDDGDDGDDNDNQNDNDGDDNDNDDDDNDNDDDDNENDDDDNVNDDDNDGDNDNDDNDNDDDDDDDNDDDDDDNSRGGGSG